MKNGQFFVLSRSNMLNLTANKKTMYSMSKDVIEIRLFKDKNAMRKLVQKLRKRS